MDHGHHLNCEEQEFVTLEIYMETSSGCTSFNDIDISQNSAVEANLISTELYLPIDFQKKVKNMFSTRKRKASLILLQL